MKPVSSSAQLASAPLSDPDSTVSTVSETEQPFRGIRGWIGSTAGLACLGSLLLFAAQPPLGWSWLAWLAPVPWVELARRSTLAGRRPYRTLWLAGSLYWLLALHWLRLPHPATSIGWLAMAGYLGLYLPTFLALTRLGRRPGVPLPLMAAGAWTALEWLQAHLVTGFNMASLGLTQVDWLGLIQMADLAGGYALSFLIMFVAACLVEIATTEPRLRWRPAGAALGLLALALGYGHFRLAVPELPVVATITLIQGSIDTEMKGDAALMQQVVDQYVDLTRRALAERSDTDLIVWPETMYRWPLLLHTPDAVVPPQEQGMWTLDQLRDRAEQHARAIATLPAVFGRPMLLGIDTWSYDRAGVSRYNSALLVTPNGRLGPRYDKRHPVLFGEYLPFTDWFPSLYQLTPLTGGIQAGTNLDPLPVPTRGGSTLRLSASICYESVLPHVMRAPLVARLDQADEPEVLVNLTNDGWFWGSSELDMHLACGILRAVECRKPLVIAANTGFSAWIDGSGRIVEQGPRRQTGWIHADVRREQRRSFYLRWGDWLPLVCLAGCGVLLASAVWSRRR